MRQQVARPPCLTMITTSTLNTLACTVRQAQDSAQALALPTAQHADFSVDDGYAVLQHVQQARIAHGATRVGRKIGFTNANMWARYQVHQPIWGPMYQHTVCTAGSSFSLRGLMAPKIEPEIVLHFHRAPPPGADAAAVLACIDWVAQGFEIVQCHYADWQFTAADAIADGSLHGALLVGQPVPVSTLGFDVLAALRDIRLDLHGDAVLIDSGTGVNALGNPLMAAAHLVQLLVEQEARGLLGAALQAGETVTTGTVTAAFDVRPGQTWSTAVHGMALPELTVAFTA